MRSIQAFSQLHYQLTEKRENILLNNFFLKNIFIKKLYKNNRTGKKFWITVQWWIFVSQPSRFIPNVPDRQSHCVSTSTGIKGSGIIKKFSQIKKWQLPLKVLKLIYFKNFLYFVIFSSWRFFKITKTLFSVVLKQFHKTIFLSGTEYLDAILYDQ